MIQMDVERVERIKHSLPDELLPGLIAVFSKHDHEDLLLVYLRQALGTRPPRRLAITAAELPNANLMDYDGPILGLAAVDLLRADIPTKGPRFVRLDRFLRRRGQVALLRQTFADLASYLTQRLGEANGDRAIDRDRALAEIAAIAAPLKLAALPDGQRRGLVAFIPSRDEAIRLDGVPLDAMGDIVIGPDEKVIAFEEVRPLIEAGLPPELRGRFPIELRTILRRSELGAELPDTLAQLATAFHDRWQHSSSPADCECAYGSALERLLADHDDDDLVAVIPDADFGLFRQIGTGTFVYRGRLEGGRERTAPGVRLVSLEDARQDLARPASPVVFSLLPLRALCGSQGTGTLWFDLGPPLRRSGRTEILARNAALLVQDLLDAPRDERAHYGASLESLLATIVRCCAIFSLTDPWRIRQVRRNEWLRESYTTLRQVLDMLRNTSGEPKLAAYYTALECWYGCALNGETGVQAGLELMVATLARRSGPAEPWREQDATVAEDAQLLHSVGSALLDLLRGGGRAEAYQDLLRPSAQSVPQVLRETTDMARPMGLLSVPFLAGFQRFAGVHDTIQRTRAAQIPVRDKIDQLAASLSQLRHGRRLILAPLHQEVMLGALYDRAINETHDLVKRLRGGASLDVELRTGSIAPRLNDSGIVLAVRNVGSVAAQDVEVELAPSDEFELLDLTFKQTLPALAADAEHAFRFAIRSLSGDDTFRVRCMVSGADAGRPRGQRQQRTHEFVIRVVGLESGPFQQKPNPYVFGVHLEEHRHFYGRRSELEQLLGHLANRRPQNMLLRGARRTGKTSLLYMVRATLTDVDGRSGVRAWFDLPRTWYDALDSTVPVILNLQGIDALQRNPTPTRFYHAVVDALHEAGLRCETSELLLDEPTVAFTQFVKALRDIVQAAGGLRPVMLVDEFDVLDKMDDKSFYGPLRTVISSVQGITWIVASALGLYHEVRAYESPLFNVFKIIPMRPLEPETARRLILDPWQHVPAGSALQFADDAVESILEEAGRYPYFIQLLCSEVVDYANASRTNVVQYKTVVQVIDRRLLLDGGLTSENFAFLWDRAGTMGKAILLTLLHSPLAMGHDALKDAVLHQLRRYAPTGREVVAQERFEDSLQRLEVVDAVRRVPGGSYTFGIPLFRRLLLKRSELEDLERATLAALAAELAGEGAA